MDYSILAQELIECNSRMRKARPHRMLNEAVRGEGFVLQVIYDSGGDVLPGEISKQIRISSARIAATLNNLETKSLITRQIDPNDRRQIIVRITDEGRSQAMAQQQGIIDEVADMLMKLGEHDAKEYVRILCRIADFAPIGEGTEDLNQGSVRSKARKASVSD